MEKENIILSELFQAQKDNVTCFHLYVGQQGWIYYLVHKYEIH